jgi:hypothetical protein
VIRFFDDSASARKKCANTEAGVCVYPGEVSEEQGVSDATLSLAVAFPEIARSAAGNRMASGPVSHRVFSCLSCTA